MALEKFHHEFEDGSKISARPFKQIPFSVFRKLQRAGNDEEESFTIMVDAFYDSLTKVDAKTLDKQPMLEVVNLISKWSADGMNLETDEELDLGK